MSKKDKKIFLGESSNPLARPPEGDVLADEWHYLLVFDEDGPKRVVSSNASWDVHESAEDFSTTYVRLADCLVVRERDHKAVAFYRAGEGHVADWQEGDPEEGARQRREQFGR